MNTPTPTLVSALRAIANDVRSDDGIIQTAIIEAADRLEKFYNLLASDGQHNRPHSIRRDPHHLVDAILQNGKGYLRLLPIAGSSHEENAAEAVRRLNREALLCRPF